MLILPEAHFGVCVCVCAEAELDVDAVCCLLLECTL